MIADVVSGWLYATSDENAGRIVADLTLTLPTKIGVYVYAEIMLTYLSQGVSFDQGRVGALGTRVLRGTVMGSSGIEYVDIPADPANNSVWFDKCLAVDFRLVCNLAKAYANADVWMYGTVAQRRSKFVRLTLEVTDKKDKRIKYSHAHVAEARRLPKIEVAHNEALNRATQVLKLKRSQLDVRIAERSDVTQSAKMRKQKGGEPQMLQLP
jgi:hypothetical protein